MARTIEQVIKEQVAELFMQYAAIMAAYETAIERIKELEAQVPKAEDPQEG